MVHIYIKYVVLAPLLTYFFKCKANGIWPTIYTATDKGHSVRILSIALSGRYGTSPNLRNIVNKLGIEDKCLQGTHFNIIFDQQSTALYAQSILIHSNDSSEQEKKIMISYTYIIYRCIVKLLTCSARSP